MQQETLFRQIAEASPIAMLVTDGTTLRAQFRNKRFNEIFGFTDNDFHDVNDWWPLVYPDEVYREQVKEIWYPLAEKAMINQCAMEKPVEVVMTCKDGTTRYIQNNFTSFGAFQVVFFNDVSVLKRTEDAAVLLQELFLTINRSANFNTAAKEAVDLICKKNAWPEASIQYHKIDEKTALGKAWVTKKSVIERSGAPNYSAYLAIPIVAKDEVICVLDFFIPKALCVEDFKMQTLASMAQQLGNFFETRIAEDELFKANSRTARLAIATSDIANSPLQTLLCTTELLNRGKIETAHAVTLFEKSLRRLISISKLFRRSLSSVEWNNDDLGFDPWKFVQNELQKMDRVKKP